MNTRVEWTIGILKTEFAATHRPPKPIYNITPSFEVELKLDLGSKNGISIKKGYESGEIYVYGVTAEEQKVIDNYLQQP